MNCLKARRWFGAYWDDEITQAERERLEAHFAACPRCRTEYEQFARTLESLAALPRQEASPDFVELTLGRARRAVTAPDAVSAPRPLWAPVAVAASLLIVAATLVTPLMSHFAPVAVHRAAPVEPKLVAQAPVPAAPAAPAHGAFVPNRPPSQDQVAALVDSLIDHSDDVDFVLDPVQVSRERTASRKLGPAQSQQAVINF